ncbi:hypothetical protein [Ligilactobacillus faecis]|uniref:hypothetical protein n=1 Tax=Ligilactobacillus faecis TaxID=762833 RepID=UPI0024691104|nr:hypothetical protein [Ligilactobacillus faecis]WGN89588.1 hypothetical protein QFX10_00315 [Ligilactobacillus faecis]
MIIKMIFDESWLIVWGTLLCLFYCSGLATYLEDDHADRDNNNYREVTKKLYLVDHEHQGVNKNFLVMANNAYEAEKLVADQLDGKSDTDKQIEIW